MNYRPRERQLMVDLVLVAAVGTACVFVPQLYGILAAVAVIALVRGMLVAADHIIEGLAQRAQDP